MKLIGSMTEHSIRDELMKSRENLLVRGSYPNLLLALRRHFPEMANALILNWVPEQDSDIYDVMVDELGVATLEITRNGSEVGFEMQSMAAYEKELNRRIGRIRFAVACDILTGKK